jgi:fructose-1,6-bisphosphatase/inositol monophosphatase family enzyme
MNYLMIDGTTNFAHHIPFCCISLALFQNGVPNLGIVYNPVIDELFYAVSGQGAYRNTKALPLLTLPFTSLNTKMVSTEYGVLRDEEATTSISCPCELHPF